MQKLATGISLPSGMTFERTAPMPTGDASHASLTGNMDYNSTCSDVIMRLALVKA